MLFGEAVFVGCSASVVWRGCPPRVDDFALKRKAKCVLDDLDGTLQALTGVVLEAKEEIGYYQAAAGPFAE